ncbi:probable RNA 3'-terminal phosphate cyclase-like protein [Neocloeon triangulifer]|uniref:probable RNA 3'-terminal phosphate cyclase-like protein n=1 Tax=Neocloeon triangulifer TaxID=2078957 RepID=UPI00286F91E6|nr:probable RNA 3'-terminal phosphate cyclase-like protein [Neocloeon triangulifer]
MGEVLTFKGSNFLRQRLILSCLSARSVRITEIRSMDIEPGLKEYEVNLIRLLDKLTNGTKIVVSETGTSLFFQPGILVGGVIEHDCCVHRGIGYYLEVLLSLGPFCKKPLQCVLRGVTNNKIDPSVDSVKAGGLPVLKKFILVDDGLELRIDKRGMPPAGGGQVIFKCPVRKLRPQQFNDAGKVKKIRGVSFALRVSPAMSNRIVEAAKGVLLKFLPDVYITTDHNKGASAGKSPGFGLSLVAETTNGVFYTADAVSNASGEEPSVPETIGEQGAFRLLEEIYRGGCVDSTFQNQAMLYMALGQKDISKFRTGPLSEYSVHFLRHVKDFLGLTYKLESYQDEEEDLKLGASKVNVTCIGIGYSNLGITVV